jgi:hypothetical protein
MRMHYIFPVLDFGAGAEIYYVKGPKGRKGKLVDYGVHHVTEAFTADTLPAYVSVGTAADADAYGDELSMGTAAIDVGSVSVRTSFRDPDDLDDYILDAGLSLPADTKVGLHCTSPTGGTPAGIAQPFMIIDWED